MGCSESHDRIGSHIDWALEDVTARQIDWFWSNHVIVVAGLRLDEAAMRSGDPMGDRIPQWPKSDRGVRRAIGSSPEVGFRRGKGPLAGIFLGGGR